MKNDKFQTDKPHMYSDGSGLSLVQGSLSLQADFRRMLPRIRRGNLRQELLVKAARLKRDVSGGADLQGPSGPETAAGSGTAPLVLDATAGFGEDSFLLAAAGFNVIMFEKDPVIAALLSDALRRAAQDPELADIVSRMSLTEGDSITAMKRLAGHENRPGCAAGSPAGDPEAGAAAPRPRPVPDVIYLDPMFPKRTKSASIKKKFQLLQQLEHPCENEEELLAAAIAARPKKIVIKRPLKGPYLAGIKPAYSLSGSTIRYDCILP